jgi:hypothetical protein
MFNVLLGFRQSPVWYSNAVQEEFGIAATECYDCNII